MADREYAKGGIVTGSPGRIVGYQRERVIYPDGRVLCMPVPVFESEIKDEAE